MSAKKSTYRLVDGWANAKVSADVVYRECENLRRRGQLTPRNFVRLATPPDHPLHAALEWDDAVAGQRYRENQARNLIRSISVVTSNDKPRRVYIHVPAAKGEGIYDHGDVIAQHIDMFAAAQEEAVRDLLSAQERLNDLRRYAEGNEDRLAVITIAAQALMTARDAVQRLH
jgi:hypothetical protein